MPCPGARAGELFIPMAGRAAPAGGRRLDQSKGTRRRQVGGVGTADRGSCLLAAAHRKTRVAAGRPADAPERPPPHRGRCFLVFLILDGCEHGSRPQFNFSAKFRRNFGFFSFPLVTGIRNFGIFRYISFQNLKFNKFRPKFRNGT